MANPTMKMEITPDDDMLRWSELSARAEAAKAEILGLQAQNDTNKANGWAAEYGIQHFAQWANTLNNIADEIREIVERRKREAEAHVLSLKTPD